MLGAFLAHVRRAAAAPTALAWRFYKTSSGAKKRFRLTKRGVLKRKADGMRHNTGLKRPSRQSRKRAITTIASAKIVRRLRRMIGR